MRPLAASTCYWMGDYGDITLVPQVGERRTTPGLWLYWWGRFMHLDQVFKESGCQDSSR